MVVSLQVAAMAKAGQAEAKGSGGEALGSSFAASPRPNREQDWKRSNWDMNWYPCGMPALWVVAGAIMPQG